MTFPADKQPLLHQLGQDLVDRGHMRAMLSGPDPASRGAWNPLGVFRRESAIQNMTYANYVPGFFSTPWACGQGCTMI